MGPGCLKRLIPIAGPGALALTWYPYRTAVAGNISMSRFVQSEERTQDTFLPCRLEDYIGEDNPV